MTITLKSVDLQVLLPRIEPTVRYQARDERQVDLRHQFALQEQRQYTERGQQVQKPPQGERGRLETRPEGRRRRRYTGKRKEDAERKRKVEDPLRGRKLDFRV
ncbi:MAG: hypothetical protein WAQ41_09750 [bacterium]|jgi:hypothetical protein|nr:hypothetical protein [Bacillota bacterium]HHW55400.1 hypothetical protein [Bacillota bacterium]